MGCSPARGPGPQLIQIGGLSLPEGDSSRSIAAAVPPPLTKPKAERTRKRIDFHCPDCGTTRAAYPNYRHKCEPGPVDYQVNRRAICDGCESNDGGVCGALKSRHPDRDCLIEIGISRPGWRCPAGKWERTLWNCQRCGSSVFDAGGLDRCQICHPRPLAKLPDFVAIPDFSDTPATPSRSLAVVSVAVGQNALDLSKLTWPRMREYAEFVGADFLGVMDDKLPSWPIGNKFRAGTVAKNYQRSVFLDADVWLRPNVGNLFELFPAGKVWMHPDSEQFDGEKWAAGQSVKMATEQGVLPNKSRIYNTGVVLFDQTHCDIWSPPPNPVGIDHVAEQFWVEHQALGVGVGDLSWEYNCQWYWPRFRELESMAKIIHLANCPHGERISRLKLYARRYGGDFI